ncbi:MAG TPA: hypothetical protein VF016_10310 [Nitrososphaera sp.]
MLAVAALLGRGGVGEVVMLRPSEIPTLNTRGTLAPGLSKALATPMESPTLLENTRGVEVDAESAAVFEAVSCRCVGESSAKAWPVFDTVRNSTIEAAKPHKNRSSDLSCVTSEKDLGKVILR